MKYQILLVLSIAFLSSLNAAEDLTDAAVLYKLLHAAVQDEDLSSIKKIITLGANPDFDPFFGLLVKDNEEVPNFEIMQFLLEAKANPDPAYRSPLITASRANKTDIVFLLLKHHANPNRRMHPWDDTALEHITQQPDTSPEIKKLVHEHAGPSTPQDPQIANFKNFINDCISNLTSK